MKQEEAKSILKWHGFEITNPQKTRTYHADILHPVTGSHIHGGIYENSLYINPSLEVNSQYLWFNFVDNESTPTAFEKTVEKLEEELKRYEETMRSKRVESIIRYFKERDLKRLRLNELLSSVKRGEHLSREELRELSAMGYTI